MAHPFDVTTVEACPVVADPWRFTRIALWHPSGEVPDPPPGSEHSELGTLGLIRPTARSVRTEQQPARLVTMAEAIPWLVGLAPDPATSTTLATWAVVVRMGVDLVSRGRLLPAVTPAGFDGWRVGPLDVADEHRRRALIETMPARAHALAVAGPGPRRIVAPDRLVQTVLDAVADTLVRTAAGPAVAGTAAFAGPDATEVSNLTGWLTETGRGLVPGTGARPGIRLDLPVEPDPDGSTDDPPPVKAVLQLRSHADPSLVVDAAELWDSPTVVLDRLGEEAETDLLVALRRGAPVWAPLARALEDARPGELDIDDDEMCALLGPTADELAAVGFEVLWPSSLMADPLVLRTVLSNPAPGSLVESGLNLEALLKFHWQATLGGQTLTDAELAVLAEAKRPLVRLRGRWVAADPARLERLQQSRSVRAADALAGALRGSLILDGEEVEVDLGNGPLAQLAERLRALGSGPSRELAEPPGLDAELRPYQRRGVAWLTEMVRLGVGGCLADDMGLGKTIQVIALHLHRRAADEERRPTLVICPATLLGNWEREVNRFAPQIPIRRYHGRERHLDDLAEGEIVLATYGVVRRDTTNLAETTWGLVVADEAQHAKNPLSRTARALRAIPAPARVALTGTPVENRLSDLWALLDWTTPGLLGPLETFRRQVAIPVERHADPDATERLAQVVRPFLLRRRKSDPDIAPELPAKTERNVIVPLSPEQVTLYEAMVRETLDQIGRSQGIQRRGLVLKLLTGLKQITNHPAHFLGQTGPLSGRSGKLDALDELLDVIVAEGDATLVFTQYVAMGKLLVARLTERDRRVGFLHGRVPVRAREDLVDRFQAGELDVLVLSLKAGGTGLNLTRATHVVHFDRWWNPAVEDQATDRAYRIGQDRPVQVHRLVSEGTIEDRIAELLDHKRGLAEAVVGSGEAWISELDDHQLAELVNLRGVPA